MNAQKLIEIARRLVSDDKGLLAMDESNATCDKRLANSGASWRRDGSARRRSKGGVLRSTQLRSAFSATNLPVPRRRSSRSGTPLRDPYQQPIERAPFRPFA
jgi:fructose-bisphosphate aldolase class I